MIVSVLINNFNNAPYLKECLDSVFAQTRVADEVIFYDDGSSDESLHVAKEYENRMTIVAARKGGGTPIQNQGRAIYEAFRKSTGDIVFLLDGDDMFLPEKVGAYIEVFDKNPDVVMVQAPLLKIDRAGRVIGLEFDRARHQTDYLAHIYRENEINVYYPTSALAFRRSYLERRLPLNSGSGQVVWPDAQLALLAPHFGRVIALQHPYSLWRRHPRSHTVFKALSIYRMVRHNQEYFNSFCRLARKPMISPWRSMHHLMRCLRHYLFSDRLEQLSRRLRWALMSERKRKEMLAPPELKTLMKRLKV